MLIYGHRGARGEAPENTLAGFHRAIHVGAPRVELDLRLSRDDELVVIHDDTLNRTTNGRGAVAQHSTLELGQLDARRGGPRWPTPQPVPTISRVLEEFPQLLHLQLEAKPLSGAHRRTMAERLVMLFREHDLYRRATVTSFDVELLQLLRTLDERVPLGLVADRKRPDPLKLAQQLGAGLLVLHWKLCSAAMVYSAHEAGLAVSAWTVNHTRVLRRLYGYGIDSVVTDYPARMVPLVRQLDGLPLG